MAKLYLLRHSETKFTQEKKYYGRLDISISDKGVEQAKALEKKLEKIKIDKIFVSPLKRTMQTAKIVFKDRVDDIIREKNLIEIDFGKWEGLSYEEILKEDKEYYLKWLKDPFKYNIPKGEGFSDIKKRVSSFLDKVADLKENIAVITHSGVIKVMIALILKIPSEKFWNFEIGTASMSVLEFFDKMPIIKSLNDRA